MKQTQINILVVAHSDHDVFAWYRHVLPIQEELNWYRRVGLSDYNVTFTTAVSWKEVNEHDIVIVPKPSNAAQIELIRLCSIMDTPVIVDLDDNLPAIRQANPIYQTEAPGVMQAHLDEALSLATAVIVSTPELEKRFKAKNPNTVVVPPILPAQAFYRWKGTRTGRYRKVIYWRGGGAHIETMVHYRDILVEVINSAQAEGTLWLFAGLLPWPVLERANPERSKHLKWQDSLPDAFIQEVSYQPNAHLVLLQPNEFDMCRSETAYLEATLANAYTVAPVFPEYESVWDKPGVLAYHDKASLRDCLYQMLAMPEAEEISRVGAARSFVEEHRCKRTTLLQLCGKLVHELDKKQTAAAKNKDNAGFYTKLPAITNCNPLDK